MADYNLGTARGIVEFDAEKALRTLGIALPNAVGTFDSKLRKSAATFAHTGAALVGFAGIVTAGFVMAVKSSEQFDTSMEKIVGLVGVSQKQVDQWRGKLLDLGAAIGKSPKELADAMYFVTSAGFRGAAALDVLTISARASAAGLGETKVVADAVTSAVTAYGIKNLSAAKSADILVATVREGKVEAAAVAGVLGRVIPVASELGISFDQVGAALASMTRQGIGAEGAATRINGILNQLIKPSAQGALALKSVGLSFEQLQNDLKSKGLLATLTEVRTAFHGNTTEMAKVFNNTRALSGVMILTGKNAAANAGVFDRMSKSTGSLDAAFKAASNTAGFKYKKAMESLKVSMIQVGDIAAPMAVHFANAFLKITTAFRNLSPTQQKLIVGVIALAAALAGITGTILLVASAGLKMYMAFKDIKLALAFIKSLQLATKAMAAFNLVMAANPIVLIVLAVIAIGAALFILYKKSETFRKGVEVLWKAIQSGWHAIMGVFSAVRKIIGGVIDWVGDRIRGFTQGWHAMFAALNGGGITTAGNKIVGVFERIGVAIRSIIKFFQNLPSLIVKGAKAAVEAIITEFKRLPMQIAFIIGFLIGMWVNFFIIMPIKALEFAGKFVANIISWLIQLPGKIWNLLLRILVQIGTWELQFTQWAIKAGTNFVKSLINFIEKLPGRIWSFLVAMLVRIGLWERQFTSWAIRAGSNFINGVINFVKALPGRIAGFLSSVITSIGGFVGKMASAAGRIGFSIINGVINFAKNLPGKMGEIINKMIQAVKDAATKAFDAMKSIGSALWKGFKKGIGIGSPSLPERAVTSMVKNIGKDMVTFKKQVQGIQGMASNLPSISGPSANYSASGGGGGGNTTVSVSFAFNGVSGQDASAIKDAVTSPDVMNQLIMAARAGQRPGM